MSTFEHYCLFGEPWWLDIVAGPGQWEEVRVESSGKPLARLPFVRKKKFGFTALIMPPLTQTLGPWFASLNGKYEACLSQQKKLAHELIKELPPHDLFQQNFHHQISNWLPWHWQGYSQTT